MNKLLLTGSEYKELIAIQKGFSSTDNSRPVLNGMVFESEAGQGRIIAIDGYKMNIATPEYMQDLEHDFKKIVALPVLKVTKKQNVFLEFNEDSLSIISDYKIDVQYIDGEPIKVDKIIPTEDPYYTISYDIKLLIAALTAYKTESQYIKFEFSKSNSSPARVSTNNGTNKGIVLPVRTR